MEMQTSSFYFDTGCCCLTTKCKHHSRHNQSIIHQNIDQTWQNHKRKKEVNGRLLCRWAFVSFFFLFVLCFLLYFFVLSWFLFFFFKVKLMRRKTHRPRIYTYLIFTSMKIHSIITNLKWSLRIKYHDIL